MLASRWNGFLTLPSLQFAFLQRDGCLEATSLLHALLRHSNSTSSGLALAFIDVSKAFDSISHDTIIRSAAAFGAPPPLVSYLAESYKQAVAQFPNLEAKCQRGVKQGDPLSPLLFIMAMDEVLTLALPELGYQFHDTLVNGFAYADDLILIAVNVTRLKEKLAAASTALWDAGMTINAKKTKIITIAGNKKRCQTALNGETLDLNDQTISSLSPTDQFSYLGIPFTWKGKVAVNHRLEVDRQLSETRKAPLKPYQRMEILRFYLIPKMMHSLTLGQVHRNTLKRLDTMIRQAVRAWLRLPNNTPTGYFHTAV